MVTLAARPDPVTLDLDRTALIVVDMQNAFAKKGGFLDLNGHDVSGAQPVIEVNRRILEAAREAKVEVIYLQMVYDKNLTAGGGPSSPNYHKEPALRLMRERPELRGTLLIEGTWDGRIVDELSPRPDELVISKPRYSGFCGTSLDTHLRAGGFRYLIFTGIATNVCVESTARDAFFGEFWPILVEDAMNHAGPDFCRESTLWNFENVFGWVTNAESVLETFESAAERRSSATRNSQPATRNPSEASNP